MSAVSTMTTEQLLAFPEDGVERELIRGELRNLSCLIVSKR
jgi:hypothetical protein